MRLMIVGSLNGNLTTATQMAMDRGAKVTHAPSIESAMMELRSGNGADLLMVDVAFDVADLVQRLASEYIHVSLVACGVDADSTAAVNAIRGGALEFIPLPPDPDLIAAVLEAVSTDKSDMIYQDPSMKSVIDLASQIAASDASVLITGESGTGKEVLAKYVHQKSKRSTQSFISVNCAAIPENLLESELFGHEKGAFTGAMARRIGKFEEANGGTLLLDEISEMDVRLQAKLLRAIQERVIDRVGGTTPVKVDIRILATTNRDLAEAVRDGSFREDLLYRLNVVNLNIPPLRERPGDILALANYFASKYAAANGQPARPLSDGATQNLMNNSWPGNVRELENTLHRAVLLSSGDTIEAGAIRLPDGALVTSAAASETNHIAAKAAETAQAVTQSLVGQTVAEVERDLIIDTLHHCLGNRTHAATILGISIRTLRNKLNQYSGDGLAIPKPGEMRPVL
ncbi:MAG: sigma-54-dependent Fis family transcriptional regulator [bacterium]|nr:sigma-54-dependent Fis family transcriptional regulator [bacterium]